MLYNIHGDQLLCLMLRTSRDASITRFHEESKWLGFSFHIKYFLIFQADHSRRPLYNSDLLKFKSSIPSRNYRSRYFVLIRALKSGLMTRTFG